VAQTDRSGSGSTGGILLQPLIHGRTRLLILSFVLRVGKPVPFTRLRDELVLTDGTLSVHLTKLEEGKLVVLEKTFAGKRPLTLVKITPRGRRLFRQYVADLQSIVPGLA